MTENVKKHFWVFFPLYGIEISDQQFDISNPIFNDVTIFSKKHVSDLLPQLSAINEEEKNVGVFHEIERTLGSKDFSAFLGVKRLINLSQFPFDEKQHHSAMQRAHQISALLELGILSQSKNWCTCALVEEIYSTKKVMPIIYYENGSYGIQGAKAYLSQMNIPPERYRLKDIREIFNSPILKPMYELFCSSHPQTSESLLNSILLSSRVLANALHTVDLSTKILHSVTALEILFKNDKGDYDTVKKRIIAFIGEDNFKFYFGEEVFDARHKFVHSATNTWDARIALSATALALVSILHLSESIRQFKCKQEFLEYLDLLFLESAYKKRYNVNAIQPTARKHFIHDLKFDFFKDKKNFEEPYIYSKLHPF